jgi:hypothetical protein
MQKEAETLRGALNEANNKISNNFADLVELLREELAGVIQEQSKGILERLDQHTNLVSLVVLSESRHQAD